MIHLSHVRDKFRSRFRATTDEGCQLSALLPQSLLGPSPTTRLPFRHGKSVFGFVFAEVPQALSSPAPTFCRSFKRLRRLQQRNKEDTP